MKAIHYTSDSGNGTIFVEDHEELNNKQMIERVQEIACVQGNIKIVRDPVKTTEQVRQVVNFDVQVAYAQAKQSLSAPGEDRELWPIKLDLATKFLAGDKTAGETLEIMLTKSDFDKNKKDKKLALTAIAKKIIEKNNIYRAKVMRLDNILREYNQIFETNKSATDLEAAAENAKTRFNLLMTE